MVKCPTCGVEVESEANYCPRCGARIAAIESGEHHVKYEIKFRPSYSLLEVQLKPDETITAEAGAMTYMNKNIEVKTHTRIKDSGLWGTIKVSLLGGETLFLTTTYPMKNRARLDLSQLPSAT